MKLDNRTTSQIIGMQDKCHSIIDRLRKNKYHIKSYENGIKTEDGDVEISVIEQLFAASACFEMVLERLDKG